MREVGHARRPLRRSSIKSSRLAAETAAGALIKGPVAAESNVDFLAASGAP